MQALCNIPVGWCIGSSLNWLWNLSFTALFCDESVFWYLKVSLTVCRQCLCEVCAGLVSMRYHAFHVPCETFNFWEPIGVPSVDGKVLFVKWGVTASFWSVPPNFRSEYTDVLKAGHTDFFFFSGPSTNCMNWWFLCLVLPKDLLS